MERVDDLQNGYKIIQESESFCFGTDAVLLSDFAEIRAGESVVDLCSGNGIIPILLMAKYMPGKIISIEIQENVAKLAKRNMEFNNIADRVQVVCDDIKNAAKYIEKTVDVVVCNPPYTSWGGGYVSEADAKMIARHEIYCTLNDIFSCVSKILKFGGRFYIIHKAKRLAEIIYTAKSYKLEPKEVQFIHGNTEKNAKLLLMSFVLGGNSGLAVLPPK